MLLPSSTSSAGPRVLEERVDRAAETEGGEPVDDGGGCGQSGGGVRQRAGPHQLPDPDVTPALRRRELRPALRQEAEVADEAAAVGADAGVHDEHLGHDPLDVVAVEVARGRRPEAHPPRCRERQLDRDRLRGRLVVAGRGQHVGERHPGDDVLGELVDGRAGARDRRVLLPHLDQHLGRP